MIATAQTFVYLAVSLVAFGLSRLYPALTALVPTGFALVASFAEFAVVWGWHAPALHDAARASTVVFLVEQGSFLLAGLGLWIGAYYAYRLVRGFMDGQTAVAFDHARGIVEFERRAWIEDVIGNPDGPDLTAYLGRRFDGMI